MDRSSFVVPLGSSSTPLVDASPERVRNIEQAASRIDGRILLSGERFSFNQTVGERTAEAGYAYAPMLLYGRREQELGGGICQLATAVYNAALLSDLRLIERHRHSSPVPYVPLGQDATVSWGTKDLVFENPLGQPIMMRAGVQDGNVVVRILGTGAPEMDIHLETEVWEIPSPFEEAASTPGIEATLYRVRSREGVVVERQYLHRDVYPPQITVPIEE